MSNLILKAQSNTMVSGYNRRGLEENEVENQVGRISMVEFLVSSEIYRAIS